MTNKLKMCMFDVILHNLVAINMERRENMNIDYQDVRDLRNYATVCFDPGVTTGKTTWLHDVADVDDVLICRTKLDVGCQATILTPAQVLEAPLGTLPSPSAVYIDGASELSDQTLDTIYSRLACEGITFILVG